MTRLLSKLQRVRSRRVVIIRVHRLETMLREWHGTVVESSARLTATCETRLSLLLYKAAVQRTASGNLTRCLAWMPARSNGAC